MLGSVGTTSSSLLVPEWGKLDHLGPFQMFWAGSSSSFWYWAVGSSLSSKFYRANSSSSSNLFRVSGKLEIELNIFKSFRASSSFSFHVVACNSPPYFTPHYTTATPHFTSCHTTSYTHYRVGSHVPNHPPQMPLKEGSVMGEKIPSAIIKIGLDLDLDSWSSLVFKSVGGSRLGMIIEGSSVYSASYCHQSVLGSALPYRFYWQYPYNVSLASKPVLVTSHCQNPVLWNVASGTGLLLYF